jgi:hypothetical protein
MVLLFSAMGILLWVGVLLAATVLFGIIWLFCKTMRWLIDLTNLLIPPQPAAREIPPDVMPKWNASHRRYADRDLADWQEQFDALNSRRL